MGRPSPRCMLCAEPRNAEVKLLAQAETIGARGRVRLQKMTLAVCKDHAMAITRGDGMADLERRAGTCARVVFGLLTVAMEQKRVSLVPNPEAD